MRLFLLPLLFIVLFTQAQGQEKAKPRNRLAKEASPYLLMHAHNPTDWYAWGPEAFEKAKKENKLVFLSIGYSSCFWCHVMERESFNHDEVAKILNDNFVCIKVDREERPDIDHVYMTALQQLGAGGGWPLSMFLLPDGRPIVGGTYWPREDKKVGEESAPGFKTILKIMYTAQKDEPKSLLDQAGKLADSTTAALQRTMIALVDLDKKLVEETLDSLKEEFDKDYGGFGNPNRRFMGAKFPMPCRLELLLRLSDRYKSQEALDMVTLTLDQMAAGGIYDQIGGGFHRYSTERTWTVPHFEKMLYDNGQLVELYSKAYRRTKNPTYRRIVAETIAYLQRDMLSPEGAFYSSQDAETHHEEGRSYVWTEDELKKALPDDAELNFARRAFALDQPNFEKKYHILTFPRSIDAVAKGLKLSPEEATKQWSQVKTKLLTERGRRDQPLRNDIALTAWSGLMIAGLAQAGVDLEEPAYLELARKAADFVLAKQRTAEGRLWRTYGAAPGQPARAAVPGYLEDYAFLSHGLLNLHEATRDKKYLDAARDLTDAMIKHHGDQRGGFYVTAHDSEKLFARGKDQFDGAQPSGNSVATRNLVRLWQLTGDDKFKTEAEKAFKVFAAPLKGYPAGMTAMAEALDRYLEATEKKK